MNRKEYYEKRRIYRLTVSCISTPSFIYPEIDGSTAKKAWNVLHKSIYQNEMNKFKQESFYKYSGVKSWPLIKNGKAMLFARSSMRCNYQHLPNSYPHKTKNP